MRFCKFIVTEERKPENIQMEESGINFRGFYF